jgi:NAD(P)H-hydrate epimerase
MAQQISNADLEELISSAAHAHHQAYLESDGVDPDWAMYYAGYLEAHLGNRLGRQASRSELTYLLIKAQRAHDAADDGTPFNGYYASVLLAG